MRACDSINKFQYKWQQLLYIYISLGESLYGLGFSWLQLVANSIQPVSSKSKAIRFFNHTYSPHLLSSCSHDWLVWSRIHTLSVSAERFDSIHFRLRRHFVNRQKTVHGFHARDFVNLSPPFPPPFTHTLKPCHHTKKTQHINMIDDTVR